MANSQGGRRLSQGIGNVGKPFPDDDMEWQGISMMMLEKNLIVGDDELRMKLLSTIQDNLVTKMVDTDDRSDLLIIFTVLKNVFYQIPNTFLIWQLKAQILATMTSIAITGKFIQYHESHLSNFINMLVDFISPLPVSMAGGGNSDAAESQMMLEHVTIRIVSCECLREMETCHPGVLMDYLSTLYDMCQQEFNNTSQHIILLFSTVLHHTLEILSTVPVSRNFPPFQETEIDILKPGALNRIEIPTEHSYHPRRCVFALASDDPRKQDLKQIPECIDSTELRKSLILLLHNLPNFTTPVICYVTRELVYCAMFTNNISLSALRIYCRHWQQSSETCLLHLAIILRLFHLDEHDFTKDQALTDLISLLEHCNHPCLRTDKQLLIIHWICDIFSYGYSLHVTSPAAPNMDLSVAIFPTAFDGLDTFVCKLNIASLYLSQRLSPENLPPVLFGSLTKLRTAIGYNVFGQTAVAFFQCLYNFYMNYYKLCDREMEAMLMPVISTVLTLPELATFLLDFIDSIESVIPDSPVVAKTQTVICERITNLLYSEFLHNIKNLLMLLEECAARVEFDTHKITEFIRGVLDNTDLCDQGNASIGNRLLSLCGRLMQYQNKEIVFTEMGDILNTVSSSYADSDIRSSAKLHYRLLTNFALSSISSSKTMASEIILSSTTEDCGTIQSAVKSVNQSEEDNLSLPTILPVQQCPFKLLHLVKLNKEPERNFNIAASGRDVTDVHIRQFYLVKFNQTVIATKQAVGFEHIYAVEIHIEATESYEAFNDILIPHMDQSKHEGVEIAVDFRPVNPAPASFPITVIFCDSNGACYYGKTTPITISLPQLFLPLLPSMENHSEELWKKFLNSEPDFLYSVYNLQVSRFSTEKLVQSYFRPFLTACEEPCMYRMVILIPGVYHILMEIVCAEANSTIRIATDCWKILGLLLQYLKGLEKLSVKK